MQVSPRWAVAALGLVQILAWGTTFYFPAVFAKPIVGATGWPLGWVVGGVSIGLLISGLISPTVGKLIDRYGGRPLLVASSLLFSAGLVGIAVATSLALYIVAWIVLGVAMGCGLYDAAFATLGRLYGRDARGAIATLTLFGGFASTVCWPLSDFLIGHLGWRGACLVYAALHLGLALPLQFVATQGEDERRNDALVTEHETTEQPLNERLAFRLILVIMSVITASGAIVIVHLLTFLQSREVEPTMAIWLGALFGPAQVVARIFERIFGARYHPIWTLLGSGVLVALALIMLWIGIGWMALVVLCYGAGYGVSWIVRGTLPLALFGPKRFPVLIGRLAFPSLIAQAAGPFIGALAIERQLIDATIGLLTAAALINLVLTVILLTVCGGRLREAR
jgi:predicted MFS family arabinose efflux permease